MDQGWEGRERGRTTDMILAARFPGSDIGRKRLWTGHVWTAARAVVVMVVFAASRAGGVGSGVFVADGVEEVTGNLREVSWAARGKLRFVVGVCWAVAERRERRKCRRRVRMSIVVSVMAILLLGVSFLSLMESCK